MTNSDITEVPRLLSRLLSRIHLLNSRDATAVITVDEHMRQDALSGEDLQRLREIFERIES